MKEEKRDDDKSRFQSIQSNKVISKVKVKKFRKIKNDDIQDIVASLIKDSRHAGREIQYRSDERHNDMIEKMSRDSNENY